MKAVIMAGGEGTRLRPITCDLPKPMAPVLGRPVMEYILKLLVLHNVTQASVTLHYLPNEVKEYFGDGRKHGIELSYAVEESPMGTAGSVKNAMPRPDEDLFVISGDAMCDVDLTAAAAFHRGSGAHATLVLSRVRRPLEYGVVVTDKKGDIVRFLEKPGWPQAFADTVNTGIYILSPACMEMIPLDKPFDFSKDLFPAMLEKGMKLCGYVSEDYWCDIGDIPAYLSCHRDLLGGIIKGDFFKSVLSANEGMSKPVMGEGARVIPPCFIGKGVSIGAGSVIGPFAVLGNNVRISDGASVKNAVLHEGASLGKNAHVRGTVLCRSVHMAGNSNAYEGVVAGTGARIEAGATINPGVRIWPGRRVEEGSVVSSDVIWEDAYSELIFGGVIAGELGILITPEFAAKFGTAFGSVVGKNCAVSCDGSGAGKLIKSAVKAGLLGAGADVWDFGEIFLGGHLFGVSFSGLEAGIYISSDKDLCKLRLCGADSLSLYRGVERKIESAFFHDTKNRCSSKEIGYLFKVSVP